MSVEHLDQSSPTPYQEIKELFDSLFVIKGPDNTESVVKSLSDEGILYLKRQPNKDTGNKYYVARLEYSEGSTKQRTQITLDKEGLVFFTNGPKNTRFINMHEGMLMDASDVVGGGEEKPSNNQDRDGLTRDLVGWMKDVVQKERVVSLPDSVLK